MMMRWGASATEPPRHWIARTMRPPAPAARPVSSTDTPWDRTSTPEASGTHAGLPLRRSGGSRVDGQRCGRESGDRGTGATDTQPSHGYDGMLNESRLCRRQVVLCPRCGRGNHYCSRECSDGARRAVNHSAGQYVDRVVHTNGIESFWAVLKRAYKGTYLPLDQPEAPPALPERTHGPAQPAGAQHDRQDGRDGLRH